MSEDGISDSVHWLAILALSGRGAAGLACCRIGNLAGGGRPKG